jgi:asparagine synthetase B (glutamine-hydrolysing)
MCGIGFVIDNTNLITIDNVIQAIIKRGPDSHNIFRKSSFSFIASVLHIQGDIVTQQPYVDDENNILLWNGEVFGGLNLSKHENDTVIVSNILKNSLNHEITERTNEIVNIMNRIQGPYSFIYYHHSSKTLYYGRDPLGRRSLLCCKDSLSSIMISLCSVRPNSSRPNLLWTEVFTDGILYCKYINDNFTESKLIPWSINTVRLSRYINPDKPIKSVIGFEESSTKFLEYLHAAVRKRVVRITNHNTSITWNMNNSENNSMTNGVTSSITSSTKANLIGVLFSGGIDSVLLASLLHLSLPNSPDAIDLMNVSFSNENSLQVSPDRLSAIVAVDELKVKFSFYKFQSNLLYIMND